MIRNLLATTAVATLLATAAYAQDTTTPAPAAAPAAPVTEGAPVAAEVSTDGHLASNIVGEDVYNGTADDAEKIGTVSDIVMTADGAAEAVVVSVGGFLGIGAKNVALPYGEFDWAERNGDRWLVIAATKEQLTELADFDKTPFDPMPAQSAATDPAAPAATTDQTAQAPAPAPAAPMTPAPADQSAEAPAAGAPAATTDGTSTAAIDRSTLKEMPAGDMGAEELVGTTVYGANDANVGEIGDVILTADGKVDAYIVNVGGFLGMGEKEVAIGGEKLAFMVDNDNNKYLYTTFTKEQLEAAPEYDEGTFAQNRDQQLLNVQ
ncbi:PRC-barrel domain-containing protein [Oryzicola mucosus]|uniref:PRC-barrel domain-containing protein n=1 Tax=Oryzicola mucosus TaxID=2767425 RepID=A0A8J6PMW5_9HYPH|nr:PRC-barrel domain-containing protein [Oryzicola mucosus]MBD0417258.1 PRC-barrel domain-containing protein [Oryzicola mucosus]